VQFQEISTPSLLEFSLTFLWSSNAKTFKGKCEAKPEFPEGWGIIPKNLPWEGYIY